MFDKRQKRLVVTEKRRRVLSLRLTDREWNAVVAASKRIQGGDMSDVVRECIAAHLDKVGR